MTEGEATFRGRGGLTLRRRSWQPPSRPRAVVVLVHGFGEHSGRYGNVGPALAAAGFAVHTYDQRGHGRSPGQRGHIDSWVDYREDLRKLLDAVRASHSDVPLFIYGHSLGSLVALDYALRSPESVAGLILSATPLQPVGVASPFLVAVAKALSRVIPRFPLNLGREASDLSRDPAVVSAYEEDPLVHGRATARWGSESLRITAWIRGHAGEIAVPILLLHGAADRIASPAGSRELVEAVRHTDKRLQVYAETYHEPHNDFGHGTRLADVAGWIAEHLPRQS